MTYGHLKYSGYKPELGHFRGDSNPEIWIIQAERYFTFYGFSEDSWLSMPYVYFKGEARAWFDWLYRNNQFYDWEHFKEKLAIHYQDQALSNSVEHSRLKLNIKFGFEILRQLEDLRDAFAACATKLGVNSTTEDTRESALPVEVEEVANSTHESEVANLIATEFEKYPQQGDADVVEAINSFKPTEIQLFDENPQRDSSNKPSAIAPIAGELSPTTIMFPISKLVIADGIVLPPLISLDFEKNRVNFTANKLFAKMLQRGWGSIVVADMSVRVNFKDIYPHQNILWIQNAFGSHQWFDTGQPSSRIPLTEHPTSISFVVAGSAFALVDEHSGHAAQVFDEEFTREPLETLRSPHHNIVWCPRAFGLHSPFDTGQKEISHLPWDCSVIFAHGINRVIVAHYSYSRHLKVGVPWSVIVVHDCLTMMCRWLDTVQGAITVGGAYFSKPTVRFVGFLIITFTAHHILRYFPFDPGVAHFSITSSETLISCVWHLPFLTHDKLPTVANLGCELHILYGLAKAYCPATGWWEPKSDSIPPGKKLIHKARQGVHYLSLQAVDVRDPIKIFKFPVNGASRTQLQQIIILMSKFHVDDTMGVNAQGSLLQISFHLSHSNTTFELPHIPFTNQEFVVPHKIARPLDTTYPFDPGQLNVASNLLGAIDLAKCYVKKEENNLLDLLSFHFCPKFQLVILPIIAMVMDRIFLLSLDEGTTLSTSHIIITALFGLDYTDNSELHIKFFHVPCGMLCFLDQGLSCSPNQLRANNVLANMDMAWILFKYLDAVMVLPSFQREVAGYTYEYSRSYPWLRMFNLGKTFGDIVIEFPCVACCSTFLCPCLRVADWVISLREIMRIVVLVGVAVDTTLRTCILNNPTLMKTYLTGLTLFEKYLFSKVGLGWECFLVPVIRQSTSILFLQHLEDDEDGRYELMFFYSNLEDKVLNSGRSIVMNKLDGSDQVKVLGPWSSLRLGRGIKWASKIILGYNWDPG